MALAINPATEIDIHHISEAPDGRLIVMIHQRSGDRAVTVLAGRGANQPRVFLTDDQTINRVDYVAPGFVIFDRQKTNAGLWVAPFTGGRIDVTKAAIGRQVAAKVGSAPRRRAAWLFGSEMRYSESVAVLNLLPDSRLR